MKLIALALLAISSAVTGTEKPTDVTGKDTAKFAAAVGHLVCLRGRLEEGMQGYCLHHATGPDVVFYVMQDVKFDARSSADWAAFLGKEVEVTGRLLFRSYDRSKQENPLVQVAPDYFYLSQKSATIREVP